MSIQRSNWKVCVFTLIWIPGILVSQVMNVQMRLSHLNIANHSVMNVNLL